MMSETKVVLEAALLAVMERGGQWSKQELAEELKRTPAEVSAVVDELEHACVIRKRRDQSGVAVYWIQGLARPRTIAGEQEEDCGRPIKVELGPSANKVLSAVRDTAGMNGPKIAAATGLSLFAVGNHLTALKKQGLIRKEGDGSKLTWSIAPGSHATEQEQIKRKPWVAPTVTVAPLDPEECVQRSEALDAAAPPAEPALASPVRTAPAAKAAPATKMESVVGHCQGLLAQANSALDTYIGDRRDPLLGALLDSVVQAERTLILAKVHSREASHAS